MTMATVTTSATIRAPIDRVFEYITTAKHWPQWHPATEGVSGDIDSPMRLGSRITERARIAGHLGEATWTVVEHAPNERVALSLPGTAFGDLLIAYTFAPDGDGVRFTRTLTYDVTSLPPAIPAAAVQAQMQSDSETAVGRIKAILEDGSAAGV
jgi:uncharacterized protein YndB with AHSA1/START domain